MPTFYLQFHSLIKHIHNLFSTFFSEKKKTKQKPQLLTAVGTEN